jgi:hypothetical protein
LSRVQVIDMDKVIVATLFAHSDVGDLFWLFVQRVFEVFAGDGEAGPLISLKELVYHHDKLFWQYFDWGFDGSFPESRSVTSFLM